MKRLTERSLDYCTQLCSDEDAISCAFYKGEQEEKCWRANMYDRLAAYEDTGLEPEQVKYEGERTEGSCSSRCTLSNAADAIEELISERDDWESIAKHKAKIIKKMESEQRDIMQQLPNWISVGERLPEPFVCVLAHIPGEKPFPTVKSAFLEKNGLWYSNGFRYNPEEVTHWCEMPAPPKGGNHDN